MSQAVSALEEELRAAALNLVEKIDLYMPGQEQSFALERALSAIYAANISHRNGISPMDAMIAVHEFVNMITAGIEIVADNEFAEHWRLELAERLLTGSRDPVNQPIDMGHPSKDGS